MISRLHLSVIILLAFLVAAALCHIGGENFSLALFKKTGAIAGIVFGLVILFDLFLWRWSAFQGWFVKRPHLWGEWKVEMKSTWIDQETGKRKPVIEATFSIKQTYSKLYVRMRSAESPGDLVISDIVHEGDRYKLIGIYKNEPDMLVRQQSPIHYGGFILNIEGSPNDPTELNGFYWTDRGTRGEIRAHTRQVDNKKVGAKNKKM